MKEMTPMKRFNGGLTLLKDNLKFFFEHRELNKSSPKYGYDSYYRRESSKGVESDYLLIFSNRHFHKSFALTFNYIDLPLEKQSVSASVKIGEDNDTIESSINFNLDEFKMRLNNFNKFLASAELSQSKRDIIVNEFINNFLDKKLDVSKEVSDLKDSVVEIEQKLNEKYDLTNKKNEKKIKSENLTEVLREISIELENSPEQQSLKKLKEEIAKLEYQLKEKKDALFRKHKVNKTKKELLDLTEDILIGEEEIKKAVDQKYDEVNINVARKAKKM